MRFNLITFRALAFLAAMASVNAQTRPVRWRTLDGKQPLIIGHRGASGYMPEHTIEGYRKAIELGADFVEPDLVSTKDGRLIARHEPLIDDTTDVKLRPEFADRKSTKTLDGDKITGFWASDFTLAEIKTLRAIQTRGRSKEFDGRFQIPTLEEIIEMVQGENSRRARVIGIYPETKHPTFHAALGLALEDILLNTLAKYGWDQKTSPVIIQSFESGNLKYMRSRTKARMVQLIDADDIDANGKLTYAPPFDKPYNHVVIGDSRGFAEMVTVVQLAEIAKYADGIGPWKRFIVSVKDKQSFMVQPNLVDLAHRAGLFVHPYTFRSEASQLSGDYNNDPKLEYIQFFALGVDAVFSDFADTAFAAREAAAFILP